MPEEATPRRTRNHDSNDGTPGGLPADDVPSTTDSQLLSDALDAKSPTDVELDDDDEHHDYHKLNDGTSYEEMVAAKRKRNLEHLKSTGLLTAAASLRNAVKGATARKNGISANNNIRKKEVRIPPATMRKSKRLAGEKADGRYVDDDRGGKFKFGIDHEDDGRTVSTPTNENSAVELPNAAALQVPWHTHEFSNRVNDGSDLTITAAIGLCDDKWIDTDSLNRAAHFVERGLRSLRVDESTKGESGEGIPIAVTPPLSTTKISTSSNADYSDDFIFRVNNSAKKISDQLSSLRVDDNNAVAKVTPDRIYSVECHPSTDALVVCAGDKQGYIGIWNVDKFHEISGNGDNIANGGVHLFKVHNRPISNLQWTNNGSSLFSFSYDSSVRMFDIHKQVFTEVFATYDDSPKFKDKSGYGLHENRVGYWVQFGCVDLRNEKCLFLSTSTGVLMHVDLRAGDHEKHAVTFQQHLSEKKINTVSLHPNLNILATAGLDCTVKLWDIRKLSNTKTEPITVQQCSKSVNSAFFSPSGKYLLATTMASTLEIARDAHSYSNPALQPSHRIRHNNHTGRWLSTFMAQWHPTCINEDFFVVGSMEKPRRIEVWDAPSGQMTGSLLGEVMTAVASRCCFHPSNEQLIACGGNSSGRVTVCRSA